MKFSRSESTEKSLSSFESRPFGDKEIFERNVVCVTPEQDLTEVAKLMREKHIGDVVVTEEKDGVSRPVGIVTDRDLMIEVLSHSTDPKQIKVADILVRSLAVAREDDGIYDMIRIMRKEGVARLPIVNAGGELIGITTSKRLLQLLITELTELMSISQVQQKRERDLRH